MKQLVLLLKPLEELIKGNQVKEEWRPKLREILAGMSTIFPIDKSNKSSPPNSLIESYYQVSLLADSTYTQEGKLKFETYYRLFLAIKT